MPVNAPTFLVGAFVLALRHFRGETHYRARVAANSFRV
jgi:hypothetical protein